MPLNTNLLSLLSLSQLVNNKLFNNQKKFQFILKFFAYENQVFEIKSVLRNNLLHASEFQSSFFNATNVTTKQ